MRVERGASQVLFGMLPGQTVDLERGVWRVTEWAEPVTLPLDPTSVREALLWAVAPWALYGNDDGLEAELRAGSPVDVVRVNVDRGVVVEPFPRQWRCRACGRIYTDGVSQCRCGAASIGQMQHVAFHTCGALKEPALPRCHEHREVAVRLPGTARAQEIYFYCPECQRPLGYGFPYQPCECGPGQAMKRNVHRAGEVFVPHYTVLVNPADPGAAERLRASGGGARALEWALAGLDTERPGRSRQTLQGLIDILVRQGLSLDTARDLAEQARCRGEVEPGPTGGEIDLSPPVRERAEEEALNLMLALDEGRVRIDEMVDQAAPSVRILYDTCYRAAMRAACLSNVELLTNFPVATLAYGFTRGGSEPTDTILRAFRYRGGLRAYGMLAKTEAILFQLDPVAVLRWLRGRGFDLPEAADARDARLSILRAIEVPRPLEQKQHPVGAAALTLLHSYAHRLIRLLAVVAGVERDALAEYLLPHHLSFIVYASGRGQFILGALQALFETSLHRLLEAVVHGESRCPLDPGCRTGGGACMACLHLGEPSCRWFNRFLDRGALFGDGGFLVPSAQT